MDTEKYCSPVATQLFLDLSSIESKDGQRDTYVSCTLLFEWCNDFWEAMCDFE